MNIQSGLDRLDEYVKRHTIKEYPHCLVTTDVLRDVLEAMRDGGEEFRSQDIRGLEARLDMQLNQIMSVEDRLARLEHHPMKCGLCGEETILKLAIDHKCKPEPSSVSECPHDWKPVFSPNQTGAIRHDCSLCGMSKPVICGEPKPTPTPFREDFSPINDAPKPSVDTRETITISRTLAERFLSVFGNWIRYADTSPMADMIDELRLALSKEEK
jgi:hypothetical protein